MHVITKLLKGKLLIAVSGGEDSIASAHHLLWKMGRRNQIVGLVHINNHILPHDETAESAVKKFASHNNLPLYIRESVQKPAGNVESWCRNERLEGILSVVAEIGDYCSVVMCHNLRDAVESYMMNCFKGKGSHVPLALETQLTPQCRIIRPYLLSTKEDVLEYVQRHDLLDYINLDPLNERSRRGWMRSCLFPMMQEQGIYLNKVVRKIYLPLIKSLPS